MSARSPNHPTRDDREESASPEMVRILFIAIGIAMLLGLLAGLVWTAYHLLWRVFVA